MLETPPPMPLLLILLVPYTGRQRAALPDPMGTRFNPPPPRRALSVSITYRAVPLPAAEAGRSPPRWRGWQLRRRSWPDLTTTAPRPPARCPLSCRFKNKNKNKKWKEKKIRRVIIVTADEASSSSRGWGAGRGGAGVEQIWEAADLAGRGEKRGRR